MTGKRTQVVQDLRVLVEKGLVWGVKAEFEAEGTRYQELVELIAVARLAGVRVAVKIGGPEAIRDLLELRALGVDSVIAPMCESGYAVRKFSEAIHRVFGEEPRGTDFFVNFETAATWANRDDFLLEVERSKNIGGVVFGRVDFSLSSGLSREAINSESVLSAASEVAKACLNYNKHFVVGGGISPMSLPFLNSVAAIGLSRFETRKIVFNPAILQVESVEQIMLKAVAWEVGWLEYKREENQKMADEDNARIQMLRERWISDD